MLFASSMVRSSLLVPSICMLSPVLETARNIYTNLNRPLYFQSAKSQTALMSGVETLPFVVMLSVGSVATGITIAKTGRYQELIWGGLSIMTAGNFEKLV